MPFSALALVALAILAAPESPSAPTEAEIVERILAVVDRQAILLSEVRTRQQALGLEREAALEALIDEVLMYAEARRHPEAAVTAAEEEAAFVSLATRVDPGAQAHPSDLRRMARRQATILRYVNLRFRPLVRVTDEAVREEYSRTYGALESPPHFDEVAAQLRERLANRELDVRVEEWLRQLRGLAEIRYNEPSVEARR
jgi:hypothetical protein